MAMLGKFRNTNAFRTLKEYSECATVHGISYIFEKVEPDMFLTLNTEGVLGPPLTEDCRGGAYCPPLVLNTVLMAQMSCKVFMIE